MPTGYTQLDCVQCAANQYIILDWQFSDLGLSCKLVADFEYVGRTFTDRLNQYLIGRTVLTTSSAYRYVNFGQMYNEINTMMYQNACYGSTAIELLVTRDITLINRRMIFTLDAVNKKYTVIPYGGGTPLQDASIAVDSDMGSLAPSYAVALFGWKTSAGCTEATRAQGKFYGFQVYNGSTLYRQYYPYKRDSDAKPGIFEIVTQTYYPSASGTDFIAPEA